MANERLLKGVASNIKRARQNKGLVQRDLVKFGYNIRHYQDIESGKANLTLNTLARLADVLGVSLSELTKVGRPGMDDSQQSQQSTDLFQASDQVVAELVSCQSSLRQEVNQLLDELGRPGKYLD